MLNPFQEAQLAKFQENLLAWNQKINLTAITEPEAIRLKHFADSLSLLPWIKTERPAPAAWASSEANAERPAPRLIDVGTGAGFPGIPLKIALPGLRLTLLDSLQKRVRYLEDTVALLGLDDVTCIHARAEDLCKQEAHRAAYDFATARAVARLDKLAGWCLPFVRPGGLFLAMKGPNPAEEVGEARPAIAELGGEVVEMRPVEIVEGMVHSVVVVRKVLHGNVHAFVV